ncbi:MAG: MOSC domain-containing protein [Dehalococcoidia bacterium]|nr:MOSC domain-containing protein [Dehalococcoidia bacterium]
MKDVSKSSGRIVAVCISRDKSTRKEPVDEAALEKDLGVVRDAHADVGTHRQVSLLALDSIEKMKKPGFNPSCGDYAENLTTSGIDLVSLPVGTRLAAGRDAILEITQIGKKCHTGCAILIQSGSCIMPKEGIFARVVRGGKVRPGDRLTGLGERDDNPSSTPD